MSTNNAAYGRYSMRAVGLLVAGGTFGAIAASALATTVAPAPAKALDACVSSILGTFKTGSASCSSQGLSLSIAIGANAIATAAGGLLDTALAFGANSDATTAPITVGDSSNFDTAIATGGGTAQASDGIFELARALHTGTVGSQGAYAEYGKFIIAQASGSGAYAYGGDGGAFQIASARGNSSDAETYDGYFDIARALGNSSSAYAYEGSLSLATALGENAEAEAEYGMAQIAQALGNTTIAKALYGRAQIAQALGYKADAEAQASNTAGQGGGNIALASFNSDAYAGDALGSGNLAVAMIDTYAFTDGTRNTAISAFGASESNAYDGQNNMSVSIGAGSYSQADGGNRNVAIAGSGGSAEAYTGNNNFARANGTGSKAYAGYGGDNVAIVDGNGSTATAGDPLNLVT